MLLTCSILSKTPMFCSQTDIASFIELRDNCKQAGIDLGIYVSCAYSYILKYHSPGHRLGLSYFLNDSVIEYCGQNVGNTVSTLLLDTVTNDILATEKRIRTDMSDLNITYAKSFSRQVQFKHISNTFIAYKKYTHSSLVAALDTPYLTNLITVLEPYFTYLLAKNCIYTPHNIAKWNNSKIEDFNFCPIYFKDRYITNELTDSVLGNAATSQGTKVHKIFEDIFTKYNRSKKRDLLQIADKYFKSPAYTSVSDELCDHTPFIQKLFLDKSSILYSLINENTEILVEHEMSAVLGNNTTFYGTADLILINGTSAHIFDYKSSKLDPKYLPKNNAKYLKQLSLYAALLAETRPDIESIEATIIYTRGLLHPFEDAIITDIGFVREKQILDMTQKLTNGVIQCNKASCFLCRHPNCKERGRESIWDVNGLRKK